MKLPSHHGAIVHTEERLANGFGARMLSKFGWARGKGLGKNEDGRSEHIRTKKKDNVKGLGADAAWTWAKPWYEDSFKAALDSVRAQVCHSDDSDSDSELSDEEIDKVVKGRDGIKVAAKKEELKIARDLAKDSWGRWGGRNGKMARIAMQEQGAHSDSNSKSLDPNEGQHANSPEQKKKRKRSDRVPEGADRVTGESTKNKTKKKKKNKKMKAGDSDDQQTVGRGKSAPEEAVGDGDNACLSQPQLVIETIPMLPLKPLPLDWWGAKRFLRAGYMGPNGDVVSAVQSSSGSGRSSAPKKRQGFREDDQEALYNLAHDHATSGKRGLGIGSMPRKVAGARWAGSKTLFTDDNHAPEGPATSRNSSKEKCSLAGIARTEALESSLSSKDVAVKLKKLVLQILKESEDGKLAIKVLQKRVVATWHERVGSASQGATPGKKAIGDLLRTKLAKWKQTEVAGKTVRIARSP